MGLGRLEGFIVMKAKYQKPSTAAVQVQAQRLVAFSDGNPGGTGSDIPWGIKEFNSLDEKKLPTQKDLWADQW